MRAPETPWPSPPALALALAALVMCAQPSGARAQDLAANGTGGGNAGAAAATALDPLRQQFRVDRLMLGEQEVARLREVLSAPLARAPGAADAADPDDDSAASATSAAPATAAAPGAAPAKVRRPPRPLSPVYMGAIIYLTADRWTFWLNGRQVSPGRVPEAFEVLQVRPDQVTLRWEPPGRDESFTFTLSPRQSYLPGSGGVAEGQVAGAGVQQAESGAPAGADRGEAGAEDQDDE